MPPLLESLRVPADPTGQCITSICPDLVVTRSSKSWELTTGTSPFDMLSSNSASRSCQTGKKRVVQRRKEAVTLFRGLRRPPSSSPSPVPPPGWWAPWSSPTDAGIYRGTMRRGGHRSDWWPDTKPPDGDPLKRRQEPHISWEIWCSYNAAKQHTIELTNFQTIRQKTHKIQIFPLSDIYSSRWCFYCRYVCLSQI